MPAPPLIWDFDGTLADTWEDLATCVNLALVDVGHPAVPLERVRAWIGHGARSLLAASLPVEDPSPAQVDEVLATFRAHYAVHCLDTSRLYDGVVEVLDALADHPMAVVSNKPHGFLVDMLERIGLAPRFALILGGDSLAHKKPHPSVLTHVAAFFDVPPASLWMIGDGETDVGAARAVGARSIACLWGLRDRAVLAAAGPDHFAEGIGEVVGIVQGR